MFTFTGLANSNPKSKPTSKPRTLVALEELCPREGHAICPTGPQREAAAFPCPLQYLLRWKVGSTCRIFRKFPLFLQSFGSDRYFGSTPKSEARKASPNFHRETHALGSLAANERHRIRWCIQAVSGVGFNHHSHRVGDWCLRLVNFFRSSLYTPFTHWLVKTETHQKESQMLGCEWGLSVASVSIGKSPNVHTKDVDTASNHQGFVELAVGGVPNQQSLIWKDKTLHQNSIK